jgi:hypothetical protein
VPFLRRAVEIGDTVRGGTHPGQLSARIELAIALAFTNEIDRSLGVLREALPRTRGADGRPSPTTLMYLSAMSDILSHGTRFAEAMDEAKAARAVAIELFGAEHEQTRRTATSLRAAAEGLGDFAAARRYNGELTGMDGYEARWELAPGAAETSPPTTPSPADPT